MIREQEKFIGCDVEKIKYSSKNKKIKIRKFIFIKTFFYS